MRTLAGATIAFGLALASLAEAQVFADWTLDPKTYRSPSGAVELHVDPTQREGGGPGNYRCTRDGKELWSGTRPYTFHGACVADDGLVAGFAYGAGERGGENDSLTIALIAPDGRALFEESCPREGYISCDGNGPDSMVRDLFFDTDNDRLVVRVAGHWGVPESWWTYSLSGKAGPRLDPRASLPENDRTLLVQDARPVPGAGLVLVQWDLDGYSKDQVVTLLDADWQVVWRLDRPLEEGATVGPMTFTLRERKTNERVTYRIERVTGKREGLNVREVERKAFEREPESATPAELPALALEHLGTIELGSAAPPHVIHGDVGAFALDGAGRPGFLRQTKGVVDFVRVDRESADGVEVSLVGLPAWANALAWTSGDRWVVASGGPGAGSGKAAWVDVASRSVTPIEGFSGPSVEGIAGTPEGGFVVVGDNSTLVAFDRDGKRLFALGGGDSRDPASLYSPAGVAVLAGGEIVVLDRTRRLLQFFSSTGEFLRSVDLEKTWGREPNYLTGVHADVGGGLVLFDFHGTPPIVRVDPEGRVLSGFDPHFPDGRTFYPRGDVQVALDGTLWASDGDALLVLDAEGAVRRVLGAAPDSAVLEDIEELTLGPDDRIYALDRRTLAVHVFEPSGKLQRMCVPNGTDYGGELEFRDLTVTDAGEVYYGRVHYGADGKRIGLVDSLRGVACRNGDGFWRAQYEVLELLGADGTVQRKIERTADQTWVRGMREVAVAPDGSMALMMQGFFSSMATGLHLFAANGDPLRSLEVPPGTVVMPGWLAYDGQHIAYIALEADRPSGLVLLEATGRVLGRFQPESDKGSSWRPFLAAGGKELWLYDGKRKIERYALP